MRFTKMHGAGNDFVVLDLRDGRIPPSPALCRRLADRHFGVGCDQILTIERSEGTALAAYRIWNADGSTARQCGNGARCVAAWLRRDAAYRGESLPDRFELDSPSGRHAVHCMEGGHVRLDMQRPDFDPASLPLEGGAAAGECLLLEVAGREVRFGAVSMGNPHAVIEVDDVETFPVATVGAALQRHPAFPDSVNVGFAKVLDRGRIRLRVFERGVGETFACGSGACAAAAHFMRQGRVDREVRVSLLGGELHIDWPTDDATLGMAGPTTFVFEGDWLDERSA